MTKEEYYLKSKEYYEEVYKPFNLGFFKVYKKGTDKSVWASSTMEGTKYVIYCPYKDIVKVAFKYKHNYLTENEYKNLKFGNKLENLL